MTEKNVPLLMATLALIKMFPEKHDQGTWVDPCSTTMCFAGHAAVISGATFNKDIFLEDDEWVLDEDGKHVPEDVTRDEYFNRIDGYKYINEYATEKLGLSAVEADYLFYHGRTRDELETAVLMFSDGYTVDGRHGKFVKEEPVKS